MIGFTGKDLEDIASFFTSSLPSPEFRHTYEEHPVFLSVSW